jgi:hypothetical protein
MRSDGHWNSGYERDERKTKQRAAHWPPGVASSDLQATACNN